ncbi:MAG: twin-arginine translocase TatA/TatE family subunit [Nitrospirae bacterium]|nr:twin-arginine translocase TatA/TatE family subunit [Nitrospirota bacterium]MCL5238314.1 twin-arginine translocase TatA/TatE family subunit [Nitrospirota bacterium]
MFGLGIQELAIILIIVLVLFGGSKLPQVGRGIGEALRNFRKATAEIGNLEVLPEKTSSDTREGAEAASAKKA